MRKRQMLCACAGGRHSRGNPPWGVLLTAWPLLLWVQAQAEVDAVLAGAAKPNLQQARAARVCPILGAGPAAAGGWLPPSRSWALPSTLARQDGSSRWAGADAPLLCRV